MRFIILIILFFLQMACQKTETITAKELKGHWVVLNYFATWCPPCIKEIPELNHFQKTKSKDILFFAVNFGSEDPKTLNAFRKKNHLDYLIAANDIGLFFHRPDLTGIPITFIISPKGKIITTLLGSQTEKQLQLAVKQAQENGK